MREMGLVGAVRGRAWTATNQSAPNADPGQLISLTGILTATRPSQI
jgi:hypothetical protein